MQSVEERLTMAGGGTLTLRQEGPRVHMYAERPADGRGLYKVWLRGDGGGRLLLGTLAPEQGALGLRRVLSVSALEGAGCWPRLRAEAVLSFSFDAPSGEGWYCEGRPERLVADPILQARLRGGMLCRRTGDGFSLSAPFRTDRPLRLPALFCLARLERRNGQLHLVWDFDGQGNPTLPPGSG